MILMKMIMTYGKKKNWHIVDDVERYRPYYIKKGDGYDYLYLAMQKREN